MSNAFWLIWKVYTKFGIKVWTANEEIEFWKSIVLLDTGTNLFKCACYIDFIDTSLLGKH